MFLLATFVGSLESHHVIKYAYDAAWLKIFYHNSAGSVYFSSRSEALYTIGTKKYSILNKLNASFKVDGVYEFLLEYPEKTGYNRWRQAKLPMNNPEVTGKTAEGYTPIHIDWDGMYWGGLVLSSNTNTLLDGSSGTTHFWYSIGETSNSYKPNFPGPATVVNQCYLWIRVDGSNFDYPRITKSRTWSRMTNPLLILHLLCITN